MAGISRITLLMGLTISAILFASYLGYSRFSQQGNKTTFSSLLPEWGTRLLGVAQSSPSSSSSSSQQVLSFENDLLEVPCGYIVAMDHHFVQANTLDYAKVVPLGAFLDPLQRKSTISQTAVQQDRDLRLIYEEFGKSRVLPEGSLFLRMGSLAATLPSPELVVVPDRTNKMEESTTAGSSSIDSDSRRGQEGNRFQLRLGRDFLRASQGRVDLDEMELFVTIGEKTNVTIPFLRPRASLSEGEL